MPPAQARRVKQETIRMVDQTRTSGQAVARTCGKFPDVSVAAGRKGFKAELDGLRDRMRSLGFPHDEIAAEIGRRYRARPREAYRLAWGWSLEKAAARFNEHAARRDADPEARTGLTGSRLSEFEHWPRSARKPSVYVLFMLAEIYATDVLCPLDLADHESLPQQDRLLLRRPRPGSENDSSPLWRHEGYRRRRPHGRSRAARATSAT
jgi:hypothetical protein